jgi:hypothetical protein
MVIRWGENLREGGTMPEWVACEWERPDVDEMAPPVINRCRGYRLPQEPMYAIRWHGRCLNTKGRWEYEPMPSSRTTAFYRRCRFATFEEAAAAFEARKEVTP